MSNIVKHTFSFNFFVKSLNLPFLKIFSVDFDDDPKGILKKEKHFQQTVFHADFKSAVKILIWAIWNFWFSIDPCEVQGKARQPRCIFLKLKMMPIGAQDSSTAWTARRISIFLFFVISVQANYFYSPLPSIHSFLCIPSNYCLSFLPLMINKEIKGLIWFYNLFYLEIWKKSPKFKNVMNGCLTDERTNRAPCRVVCTQLKIEIMQNSHNISCKINKKLKKKQYPQRTTW